MTFSTRVSKFGKGSNISAIMNNKDTISIYFYLKGIMKKEVKIEGDNLNLTLKNGTYPYSEVIPLDESFIATRIDKSMGVTNE